MQAKLFEDENIKDFEVQEKQYQEVLNSVLLETNDNDVSNFEAIVRKTIELATKGNPHMIKLLFSYSIGMPTQKTITKDITKNNQEFDAFASNANNIASTENELKGTINE